MKKIFILLFSVFAFVTTKSQSYTWTNADADNDFENPNNWNPTPLFGYPSFGETAVFDCASSNDDCIMFNDQDFLTLSVLACYTGTIDASGVEVTLTNMSLQGGALLAPSSTLHISGNCNKGAGSAYVNTPTSWLDYNLTSTTARSIVGNFGFQNLEISTTGNGNRIINFGASTATTTNLFFNGTTNPMAYRGAINVTSMLSISGTTNVAAPSNTGAIIFVGAGAKTIVGNPSAVNNPIGSIRFNTSGTVSMSNNINITGSWSVTSLGGLTAGTSVVNMMGGTVTAGNTATTQAMFDNLTTTTGSTTTLANNSFVAFNGNLTNNGSITANNALLRMNGGTQSITGTSLTLNALEANGAGNKTIGTAININDSLKISAAAAVASGGNITLKATSAVKGRIAEIAAGGSITGNVTVENFILGGNTGWALLGTAGVGGQTMNDWYDDFPMAIEGSATDVTSAGGYFESVQGWNEGDAYGYDTTITIGTALTPGKGFWTYLGTGPLTTSDITIDLVGSPVTGSLPINLTNSAQSGTCLIANPYASPIRWTLLRNGNLQVANAIYIYNADGPYATFVNGFGTNGGTDFIPAGQGFYVEALSNTSLNAQESNKVSSATQVMKTNNASNIANYGLPIKLQIQGFSGDYDETGIRFHGSATNAYDIEWDARKIFQTPGYVGYPGGYSKYTTISTKGGNLDYSINSLPYALTQNAVIPVLVKVMASGQYTINGFDMQLLPPNACVTLKDKLLNVTHNIKASPYVFTINDTTSTARFELTVCADLTTGVNNNTPVINDNSVMVKHDVSGVYVDLNFDKTTKANISVTNVLGQKIVDNTSVTTQNETVHFGLEAKNQLLFITVETESSKITKKIIH